LSTIQIAEAQSTVVTHTEEKLISVTYVSHLAKELTHTTQSHPATLNLQLTGNKQ